MVDTSSHHPHEVPRSSLAYYMHGGGGAAPFTHSFSHSLTNEFIHVFIFVWNIHGKIYKYPHQIPNQEIRHGREMEFIPYVFNIDYIIIVNHQAKHARLDYSISYEDNIVL